MSNSTGHNFLHQSLLAPTVLLEHQSKINSSCVPSNTLFQSQANSQLRKSPISTKFKGNVLNVRKTKLAMGTNRAVSDFPQAVLAADSAYEVLYQLRFCNLFDLQFSPYFLVKRQGRNFFMLMRKF